MICIIKEVCNKKNKSILFSVPYMDNHLIHVEKFEKEGTIIIGGILFFK